ncbi:phospho-sugar mutase [Terribacillus saccharophilus]|uniref:phospho-sugar mutase n=1 Tax=Terribacillus saccharophilus TaxID=361277 RepID=UPI002DCD0C63|nr:phospho-sugar mutase [Terribacillus saccharophilus]
MVWQDTYKKWSTFKALDPKYKEELTKLANDEAALEDAFYKELTFGTGGMRGVLGAGTNRMNIYTVRKAVEGLAVYMEKNISDYKDRGVAVAYDSRYMSPEFADETARVLGAHGIRAHVFESLRPTPLLSFAVRHLNAAAGIMITASHNPPEYNGFKVYNEDGGQIPPEQAEAIIAEIAKVENELAVEVEELETIRTNGLLNVIGEDVDSAYLQQLKTISNMSDSAKEQLDKLQIVFTPLHGTSHDLVLRGLDQLGFQNVHVVKEQAQPDPEFSTVESPNPEEHQAFTLAMEQGQEVGADVLIGTDPDADRLGVAVQDGKGAYQVLTGNQLGTLMLDYVLANASEEDLRNGKLVKTIVTTEMGRAVAASYGVDTIDTLTGFKYIGEKIKQFETTDEKFLFGYEESYGYLIGDFVRDKDAVQAAMIACEMAAHWRAQGKTLLEALHVLYEKHGFFLEDLHSITLKGKDGAEKIAAMMDAVRADTPQNLGGLNVLAVEDYSTQTRRNLDSDTEEKMTLPKENVIKLFLEKDSWVCLRPSGTEPKIKSYYGVNSASRESSLELLEKLKADLANYLQ